MDFLKPPTDNLYKFMCISGLILLLFSLSYPPWLVNKSRLAVLETKRDLELLEIDDAALKEKLETHRNQIDRTFKDRELISQQLDDLVKRVESKENLTNANIARLAEIKRNLEQKDSVLAAIRNEEQPLFIESRKKMAETQYRTATRLWEARFGLFMVVLSVIGAVVGLLLFRKGFNLWSTRVQVYQDAILKRQADLETKGAQATESESEFNAT